MSVQESVVNQVAVPGAGELKRGLKPRHLQLIALGGIIGSCYFLGTGYIVESTGPAADFIVRQIKVISPRK